MTDITFGFYFLNNLPCTSLHDCISLSLAAYARTRESENRKPAKKTTHYDHSNKCPLTFTIRYKVQRHKVQSAQFDLPMLLATYYVHSNKVPVALRHDSGVCGKGKKKRYDTI